MTLRDLAALCDRFVPKDSRHPNSFDNDVDLWWPAHEIGHLLTVEPRSIGEVQFGLDDDADPDALNAHDRICRELAAMHVSRRLLTAVGRSDLANDEEEGTDQSTLAYRDRGRVAQILKERGCVRVPRTRSGLVRKIKRALNAAGLGDE